MFVVHVTELQQQYSKYSHHKAFFVDPLREKKIVRRQADFTAKTAFTSTTLGKYAVKGHDEGHLLW